MKKNISINISGIIFHIEEDAYEQLRGYLQKISRYFASFEDSEEIVADIESRIAEIFLAKLSDEKQVITQEDVASLIATMGDVKDFQAVEDEIGGPGAESQSQYSSDSSYSSAYTTGDRKLYRDESRKVIGGVCAGLAHYFNINPVWIRLLAVILLFAYGIGLIPYILLWVFLPGNRQLDEQRNYKKMYRDSEHRVLGGVSSGLAAYFGTDIIVFQILFVILTFFGGFGLLLYIVLWIILPEARTLSEKMQMKGDPVTLTNIESSIKKNLNVSEKSEDPVVKVLLFPFRLIATIIEAIGRILGPILLFLVEAIRVLIGVVMIITGASLIFALLVGTGALIGLFTHDQSIFVHDIGIPWTVITESFPTITTVAVFFATLIPALFLILLGVSVIAKRIVFNAITGWSMLALFVISSIFLSINIPALVYQFRESGRYEAQESYEYNGETLVLNLNETGMQDYEGIELRLEGIEDSTIQIMTSYRSQGSSRLDAIENAKMISYSYQVEDSVFTFDSNIAFNKGSVFRAQEVDVTMYIPYGATFILDDDLRHILRNSLRRFDLSYRDYPLTRWTIDRENGLTCLTCPEPEQEQEQEDSELDNSVTTPDASEGYDSARSIESFRELEVKGPVTMTIMYGDESRILYANGTNMSALRMESDGIRMTLSSEEDEPVSFVLFTPALQRLKAENESVILLSDFSQDFMDLVLEGNAEVTADIDVAEIHVDMEDEAMLELHGKGNILTADLRGMARLLAFDYETDNIEIVGRGRSQAELNATREVIMDKSIGASVENKGSGTMTNKE
jgi:phage shock protein PspC (stress-responsive transcriptional regulator)